MRLTCEPVALRLPAVNWLRSPMWLRTHRKGVKFTLIKENTNAFQPISQESSPCPNHLARSRVGRGAHAHGTRGVRTRRHCPGSPEGRVAVAGAVEGCGSPTGT